MQTLQITNNKHIRHLHTHYPTKLFYIPRHKNIHQRNRQHEIRKYKHQNKIRARFHFFLELSTLHFIFAAP